MSAKHASRSYWHWAADLPCIKLLLLVALLIHSAAFVLGQARHIYMVPHTCLA